MSERAGHGARAAAAALVGIALGTVAAGGTALLLYTGQGFIRAAGLLISSTVMALAAGLWAGTPDVPADEDVDTRARWIGAIIIALLGGIFAATWSGRAPLRELAVGGAIAVLLVLALPAYSLGSLLAGLHMRDRARLPRLAPGGVAAATTAGAAVGVLLATTLLIRTLEPHGIYYGAAALLSLGSLLDRKSARSGGYGGAVMTGHVALITGAGTRGQLGHAVARRFVDAGASVVITGMSDAVAAIADELGSASVAAVRADLLDDDDVARVITLVRDRFGRLDSLVNIAGGLSVIASIEDTTPDQWRREIERNAETALRVTRAALPLLRASRGAVVSFTAPAGERAAANLGAYSAAKAAVIALTRALALEEAAHGVRANAIAPGMMDTAQNRAAAGDAALLPLADVADVVLFLAGDAARGVSGQTLHVAGATLE